MKFEIIARIFSFMNISEISAPSSGMKGSPRANRGSSKKITRMEVSPDEVSSDQILFLVCANFAISFAIFSNFLPLIFIFSRFR